MPLFKLDDLAKAAAVVREVVAPTPQYCWPQLSRRADCEVWVKHENHTPTGAGKVRGGLVYLDELQRGPELPSGMITATRGNHGQSIPFAAARHGVPVTVLVPEGNSIAKNQAIPGWGPELLASGQDFDAARVEAERRAQDQDFLLVPSFHPALVRGVATYAHELFTAVGEFDTVYVPIGMGSGICGLITVRDLLGGKTAVVGGVSSEAASWR